MRITNPSWGPALQNEANKFWFYAIAVSILISLYDLAAPWFIPEPRETEPRPSGNQADGAALNEKNSHASVPTATKERPKHSKSAQTALTTVYKQLLIDICDLVIPGSSVGWIDADTVTVGVASTISSIVAGQDIWTRMQVTA